MAQDPVVHLSASRRVSARQRNRRRLIDAAKQLASMRGYEAATLREVAALAGLTTGAVFANFADKADLFAAAIEADDEALLAVMRRAADADADGGPRRTLLAMLAAVQARQQEELAWVRVKMSLIWCCAGRRAIGARTIEAALAEVLRDRVRTGALAGHADPELLADMVWESYLSNCRRAVFDGWSSGRLRQRLAASVEAILDGYEVRPVLAAASWPPNARAAGSPPRALRG